MRTKVNSHSIAKRTRVKKKRNNGKKIKGGGIPSESQRNYAEMDGILGDIMEEEKYFIIDLFVENSWDNYVYHKNRIIEIKIRNFRCIKSNDI